MAARNELEPIARVIGRRAATAPDAPAFLCGDDRLSWAGYAERSDRLAAQLAGLGLAAGERVGVLLPDGIDVHVAYVGCEKAGVTVVGVGPRAGARELQHLLDRTGAAALISRESHRGDDMKARFERLRSDGLPLCGRT